MCNLELDRNSLNYHKYQIPNRKRKEQAMNTCQGQTTNFPANISCHCLHIHKRSLQLFASYRSKNLKDIRKLTTTTPTPSKNKNRREFLLKSQVNEATSYREN